MCGADKSTAMVATKVKRVKVIKHILSRTMAANFQSFSMAAVSSSSLILSVMTRSSFRIRLSSRWTPEGKEDPPESPPLRAAVPLPVKPPVLLPVR